VTRDERRSRVVSGAFMNSDVPFETNCALRIIQEVACSSVSFLLIRKSQFGAKVATDLLPPRTSLKRGGVLHPLETEFSGALD
jgi:hypothetical protein